MKRKPYYGVFINDADYVTKKQWTKSGETSKWICPIFSKWKGMVERCACPKLKQKYPTYLDAHCCEDWIYFSNFKVWMESQPWVGMDLDKDILFKGNKFYSPETCCFVPPRVNSSLVDRLNGRGDNPLGVSWHKGTEKYTASINHLGRSKHLGYFTNPMTAHHVWQRAKAVIINDVVDWWYFSAEHSHSFREDVAESLWKRSQELVSNANNGIITVNI